MSEKIFNKSLVIGLGLIGGSFAKALRQNKVSNKIYAFDQDPDSLEKAIKSGVIDDFIMLDEKISDFDFIVLATPLSAYKKIFETIADKISPQAIVIDLGSLKNPVFKIVPKNLRPNFIACHPIAGSEKTGFENSAAELFLEKKFIICPENSNQDALKKVEEVVKKIGANIEFLEAKKHDEVYALVSHLPQFISFLTKDLSPKKITDEFFKTAFRLDNSDAEIWGDIFKLNDENLEKFYLEFFDHLEKNIKSSKAILGLSKPETPFDVKSSELDKAQLTFFEENFTAIFFRAVIAASYLQISAIKNFQNYAGSGFKDFISITAILDYEPEKLEKLIQKNRSQILKNFNSLS